MIYEYANGEELDRPIGKAPAYIRRDGKRYNRVYTMPVVKQLSRLDRGEQPAVAHSLPTYYGYGQREVVWQEHMRKLGVEDTKHRRMQVVKANLGPKPKYIERRSREAAAKAGKLDNFDKHGRPIARTKREVGIHLDTAKRIGDSLEWS